MSGHQLAPMGELRELVWVRCMGRCEHSDCGLPLLAWSWECHHRKLRKQGGPDCACNLLALHPRCHTQGPEAVHDYPGRSRELGLLVPSWEQPQLVQLALPVTLRFGSSSTLLSCGGTYS